MTCDVEARARAWGAFFETLRPDNVERLRDLASPEIRFVDPFNDVRGIDRMILILQGMFEVATDVRFRMLEQACRVDACFLRWHFSCRLRRWTSVTLAFEGVSLVRFDARGRAVEHIDYWDAAKHFHGRLPVIGPILRLIGRRLQI